jgi:hypothetical protein
MGPVFIAGAAAADITPDRPMFLFGYPHVPRVSTGVHDPLLSSAVFLSDGKTPLLFIANDVIYIGGESARRVQDRIRVATGVPGDNILISATHTHSGPLTTDTLSNEADPVVPKTDPHYLERMENGIVQAACHAVSNARPAKIGLAVADGSCVGGHRHDPKGPADRQVPVMVIREQESDMPIAAMTICSMHPTVLHEDSTLISGDFPAMTRQYLQEHVLGNDSLGNPCPVIYHTGPCGNQSPRHVAKANTFEEATRLGHLLGQSIAEAIQKISYTADISLACSQSMLNLPTRTFPSVVLAEEQLKQAVDRLKQLQESSADRRDVRTAECDWFGAEETLALAQAAAAGRVQEAAASVLPAKIMLLQVGPWSFVGWPGEAFVEFSLKVKASHMNCYVISLANGDLQGYLVTEDAVREGWYEARNSLFASPESGLLLVEKTLKLFNSQD